MSKPDAFPSQKTSTPRPKPLLKPKDLESNQEIYTTRERAIERWETDGGSAKKNSLPKKNEKI